MPATTTAPKPATAAAAAKERDELAQFIVDQILNADLDDVDLGELKADAREVLRAAGYTVREEAHHD